MRRKRASASRSKLLSPDSLFGPPPLLEGEDAAAYEELHNRFSNAAKPTDFLREILVRDGIDVIWNIFRLRRILAAYLSAKIWNVVNEEASSLAESEAEQLEGTEKIEMEKLLNPDSELSWETMMAQNPRANKKYQKLWKSAKATLDISEIQSNVLVDELETIERIEHLIFLEQQRLDAIFRDLDRHRIAQKLRDSDQGTEEAEFKIFKPKPTIRKITN